MSAVLTYSIPGTYGSMVFEVHVDHEGPSLSVQVEDPLSTSSWLVWRPPAGWMTTADRDFRQMLVLACEMVDKSFDRRNLGVVEAFLSDPEGLRTALLVMRS